MFCFDAYQTKWRAAGTEMLLEELERTIAIDRANKFADEHPGEPEPLLEEFSGPPYTVDDPEIASTKG